MATPYGMIRGNLPALAQPAFATWKNSSRRFLSPQSQQAKRAEPLCELSRSLALDRRFAKDVVVDEVRTAKTSVSAPATRPSPARRQAGRRLFGTLRMSRSNRTDHIRLTSHPEPGGRQALPIHWGAADGRSRGPVIGTVSRPQDRNVIGSHGGSYAVYRALAVSAGALDPIRRPDLTNTFPAEAIGPFPQWSEPKRIVALDPWGHLVAENFRAELAEGVDIRPSIAVTRARLDLPEIRSALACRW
jgi:hypothetical protein